MDKEANTNSNCFKTLRKGQTGLLIIDIQEKLVPHVDRSTDLVRAVKRIIKGARAFDLPIIVTEQYPSGLGPTLTSIKDCLDDNQEYLPKLSFSAMDDEEIRKRILESPATQWIVVGIEAHVCVLQTVRDMIAAGRQVVVLNDVVTSRSIYDFSTAISELKESGARISCSEIVLFELLRSSAAPEFKEIYELIK